jgi:hypothetical protein
VKRSLIRVAALSAAVLVTATACGGEDAIDSTRDALRASATQTATATPTPTPTPTASAPVVVAVTPSQTATAPAPKKTAKPIEAPPGDPGPDAPEMPDPGAPTEAPEAAQPKTTIPAKALLDTDTLAAVAPAAWSRAPVAKGGCEAPLPAGAAGIRSSAFRATGATFGETVATYAGSPRADAAVTAFAKQLAKCGWKATEAPALGSSSVQATRGAQTVLMIAAEEGVTVVVRGSGTVTADPATWESLGDLAMGSSCPAAPDDCH